MLVLFLAHRISKKNERSCMKTKPVPITVANLLSFQLTYQKTF
jgi:hypothetical protein